MISFPPKQPVSGIQQSGVALISVLLVFAIVTILVSQLVSRTQQDIERTSWLVNQAQAYQYALAGETLARQLLWQQQASLKEDGINISPVPYPLPVYQPEYGEMALEIVDLQGLINLNNIVGSAVEKAPVIRLFNDLVLRPEIPPRLADWIDADSTPLPGGAEDSHYLTPGTHPAPGSAYRTGNQPLQHPSELLSLNILSGEEYAALGALVTTLPTPTPISLNTAPAEVLGLLAPNLSGAQIVNFRETNPPGFLSVDEFMLSNITAGMNLSPSLFTVTSEYFGFKIRVTINELHFWLFSRLKLDNTTGAITLMDRTIGQPFIVNTQETGRDDTTTNPIF